MNIKIRPLRMVSSQSLWSRDGFSMRELEYEVRQDASQSLWSRDGFSIFVTTTAPNLSCRNPFGAGTVFQSLAEARAILDQGRNPFGAGAVFQFFFPNNVTFTVVSQSLWSRDGFSIDELRYHLAHLRRNPFGAGTVFQYSIASSAAGFYVAIPLEQGRFFNLLIYGLAIIVKSQSLWSRDGFSINRRA